MCVKHCLLYCCTTEKGNPTLPVGISSVTQTQDELQDERHVTQFACQNGNTTQNQNLDDKIPRTGVQP